MIRRSSYDIRSSYILAGLGWETLEKRRMKLKKKEYDDENGKAPKYFWFYVLQFAQSVKVVDVKQIS